MSTFPWFGLMGFSVPKRFTKHLMQQDFNIQVTGVPSNMKAIVQVNAKFDSCPSLVWASSFGTGTSSLFSSSFLLVEQNDSSLLSIQSYFPSQIWSSFKHCPGLWPLHLWPPLRHGMSFQRSSSHKDLDWSCPESQTLETPSQTCSL